jgi:hypothetical protein
MQPIRALLSFFGGALPREAGLAVLGEKCIQFSRIQLAARTCLDFADCYAVLADINVEAGVLRKFRIEFIITLTDQRFHFAARQNEVELVCDVRD